VEPEDQLAIGGLHKALRHDRPLEIVNATKNRSIETKHRLSDRQIELLTTDGLVNYLKLSKRTER
jgi:hypothetical protein